MVRIRIRKIPTCYRPGHRPVYSSRPQVQLGSYDMIVLSSLDAYLDSSYHSPCSTLARLYSSHISSGINIAAPALVELYLLPSLRLKNKKPIFRPKTRYQVKRAKPDPNFVDLIQTRIFGLNIFRPGFKNLIFVPKYNKKHKQAIISDPFEVQGIIHP